MYLSTYVLQKVLNFIIFPCDVRFSYLLELNINTILSN